MKEIFGAGTASVVCPVNRILYVDEVRGGISWWVFSIGCSWLQSIHIPTEESGAEVAKRYYKELTDIQVHG